MFLQLNSASTTVPEVKYGDHWGALGEERDYQGVTGQARVRIGFLLPIPGNLEGQAAYVAKNISPQFTV